MCLDIQTHPKNQTTRQSWCMQCPAPKNITEWGNCQLQTYHYRVPLAFLNPLTTEFFPPRQHIFMHSAHTTFVGTPLPQHSFLSGQIWWGLHTWRDPSGNTVNDIHDPHKPAIGGQRWMSAGFLPSISLNLGQI